MRFPSTLASTNVLYVILALLVGLYSGINLSGFHHHVVVDSTRGNKQQNEHQMAQLRTLEQEILSWQAKFADLETKHAAVLNRVHTLEEEGCQGDPQPENEHHPRPIENPNSHPVCQHLEYPTPNALALWNQNILSILQATKLPNDIHFKFHDFTTQLLQLITPRLPRSTKTIPHEWDSLERAMHITWERYQYLQLSQGERNKITSPPRPLKILVMGGSLLVGTNCRKLLTELGLSFRLPKRDCTWSNRLEEFFNSYAKGELVQVTKVAMGGTNTATGNVIWQYDLIPQEARNPDVVVNAYSTNDMHILTILEAQSSNVTLRDKVFEMTQDYVRHVLQTCDPDHPPPLLLHVDDYLGNEQRTIWETTELSQGVQVLANYYGFASISYADVVRQLVYGDTREAWLSANWWETGNFEREIHPGMGMHIASTWVIAYNLLFLVTTYCSTSPPPKDYNIHDYRVGYLGLPPLKEDVVQAANKPQHYPQGLPPLLTKDLLIEDVSRLWKTAAANSTSCSFGKPDGAHDFVKCPFSWVSGLSLQQNNQTWIQEYFRNQATKWDGWNLGNDGGKLGFTPIINHRKNTTATMILEFGFPQTIRSVTLFYMKSYGEKWQGSQLRWRISKTFTIAATMKDHLLHEILISGIHNKQTSEMYTEEISLSESIEPGDTIRIEGLLSGGTMFKIMGLAICS